MGDESNVPMDGNAQELMRLLPMDLAWDFHLPAETQKPWVWLVLKLPMEDAEVSA